MTVQDVNIPPRVKIEDAKNVKPKNQDDAEYWEKHKSVMRARREALEEEKALENLQNPPQPEAPFQISGKVDLGTFNLQEEQKKAREEADKAHQEATQREKELATKLEVSQKELADTKMTAAVEKIGNQFNDVIKEMNRKIDQVARGSDPAILTAYIDSLEKLATKMGYQRSEGSSVVGDPHLAIELQKMRAEEAARERSFQFEMKKYDIEIMRQNKKDIAEMELKKEELEAKKKRDDMFASAPEMIGRAIARGMMEENSAPINQKVNIKNKGQVTAAQGESGEVDCPQCNQPIVIGPTADKAVCAGCNLSVSVNRIKAEIPSEVPPDDEEEIAGRI